MHSTEAPETKYEGGEHIETNDTVFGDITEEGPNYRNVGFIGTVILMLKTQLGIGVLSIPAAFDVLGMVPGVVCLCIVAVIPTWTNYVVGTFKLRHQPLAQRVEL